LGIRLEVWNEGAKVAPRITEISKQLPVVLGFKLAVKVLNTFAAFFAPRRKIQNSICRCFLLDDELKAQPRTDAFQFLRGD
jgi:hypothetical protein